MHESMCILWGIVILLAYLLGQRSYEADIRGGNQSNQWLCSALGSSVKIFFVKQSVALI